MAERRAVSVTIGGQEFRVRSDGDDRDVARLQQLAGHVDAVMTRLRERTGTVDTRELALLTALNLAREVVDLRERAGRAPDASRLRELVELAESALRDAAPAEA